ncbi:MAG: trigger factor, partial [Sandaracinaceae bacterium]
MSTSQVNEIDPVTVELAVQVPWDRVQKGLNAGYGKLQRTAKVRGFRPGKVPKNVLKQLYGPQVHAEVIQALVEEGLLTAVQSHELAVVATPEMEELPQITKGEPLAFKAKVEVRPTIDDIAVDGIEVYKPSAEIPDEDIEAEIERMREGEATLMTPEEPRPAKAGDVLTVSYTVQIDGEAKEEMAASDRKIELGSDTLLPEFEEGLT